MADNSYFIIFDIIMLVILGVIISKSIEYLINPEIGYSKKMLIRFRPLFFDISFVYILLIIGISLLLSAPVLTLFGTSIHHFYPALIFYLEVFLSTVILIFILLIPHFLRIGKEFKKMAGHFTWKPPKEYLEYLEQDPKTHFRGRY